LAAAAEGDTETQILIGVAALAIFKDGLSHALEPAIPDTHFDGIWAIRLRLRNMQPAPT
jgi:hypothetical protein